MLGREDEIREYREQIWLFQLAIILAWGILFSRLVYLQFIRGEDLRKFSEANRLKKEKLLPPRGIIFDRNGKVLVDNRAAYDVVLIPQYFKVKEEEQEKVIKRLASALKISVDELNDRLSKIGKIPSYTPILLKSDVTKDVIAAIETNADGFPGVDIETTVQRRYPYKDVAAQVLGYIREVGEEEIKSDKTKTLQSGDFIGKDGLERYLDADLRGINGIGYVEVDAHGKRKKVEGAEKLLGYFAHTEPVAGNNLHLTIDVDLQQVASQSMKSREFTGAVIAIDPRNGEILTLVNEPSFESEKISGREVNPKVWAELRDNKDRPLRNRAFQDIYPPGSTFKLFMAIAALSEGVATRKTAVNCTGGMQFGNRRFACWKTHGYADFIKSIRESCDVFYYKVGDELGVDTIAKYARLFGLGQPTEIRVGAPSENRFFREQKGLIPDSEWKQRTYNDPWHPGETISVSIGQGFVSVTPVQMANAFAAIGNGGFLYHPAIIKMIEKRNGEKKEMHSELKRKIELPKEVFETVKQGLFEVANEPGGTAIISGHSKKVVISGKTGTAQIRTFKDMARLKCDTLPKKDRHHAWFVGYAPRDNPEIAVAVVAEHACHGSSAAPVVREVIEAYIAKQNLQKDNALESLVEFKPVKSPIKINRDEDE